MPISSSTIEYKFTVEEVKKILAESVGIPVGYKIWSVDFRVENVYEPGVYDDQGSYQLTKCVVTLKSI